MLVAVVASAMLMPGIKPSVEDKDVRQGEPLVSVPLKPDGGSRKDQPTPTNSPEAAGFAIKAQALLVMFSSAGLGVPL
jgi:hypothetical protein